MASRSEGTKEGEDEALRLFYSAIERDLGFAPAYGMAASCYLVRRNTGRVEDKDWEEAETRRLTTRVSVIGSDDAVAIREGLAHLVEKGQPVEKMTHDLLPCNKVGGLCPGGATRRL